MTSVYGLAHWSPGVGRLGPNTGAVGRGSRGAEHMSRGRSQEVLEVADRGDCVFARSPWLYLVGRRWQARERRRGRQRWCVRALGPAPEPGAPTPKKSAPTKRLTSETAPRIPYRGPEPQTPQAGALVRRLNSFDVKICITPPERGPRAVRRPSCALGPVLRPPERHFRGGLCSI